MEVDDVATPSAGVDAVDEALQVACAVGVVAAVPRRGGAKSHARCHEAFPVGQHGIHVFGLSLGVVGRVHGFVVRLHVRRRGAGSQVGGRRVVLVDVVGDVLHVGRHVGGRAPSVGAGDVEGGAGVEVVSGSCQLRLARIVPLEDAVGGNLLVEYWREGRHLEVLVGSNEATAVAASVGPCGEGHHIAALQLERADAVVQFCCGQRIHEAARVLRAESVARLASVLLFRIDGKRPEA